MFYVGKVAEIKYFSKLLIKCSINFCKDLLYPATFCQDLGIAIHKSNCRESAMVNNTTINYQNILLDTLDEPINITFSTTSPLN